MTALENLIQQTGTTPYAFAIKHSISNVYTKMKHRNYNLKNVIDLAKKENLQSLSFQLYDCNVKIEL